ncbi:MULTISPECIES: sensor histidine kinase [Clostridium]|uniref:histidine kinase n=2 Tax=Clostridium beijerinckii TaxID=1520 RepID=A0AAX0B7G0_CLOBE|nr:MULTISPECIES: HAMP domain-containing sensor histidine kinase [Clostridium]MBA8932697.1 signal transduction histidine kinase [Clostridium beijerinckii]MBN7573499.1 HAMP domain-containing histidine kinase [Clostridium beijerinckii]MBN7579106.1 HAMP domain-containing histidine kinase [Clostridium beijerinckii]MBN7583542.1 HAMP domain-containing histidine kinase [Clostridium beijerinckii]MBO0519785.1 HAMP domain-containing histidine kinase [Clostridium beijerinckii]
MVEIYFKVVESIRRFRGRVHPYFHNRIDEEHREFFEKLKELNEMRYGLVYEYQKIHHKQFNEFNRIHRYLRWMRPTGILISILLVFSIFKFVDVKAITIFFAIIFIIHQSSHIYITMRMEKRIMKPIEKLKDGVEQIARGNYDVKIDNDVYNEIGILIYDFNKMAETLKKSEEMKLEYEENRKALIANISHDLKTPITSINGYIEALVDGVVTSPDKVNNYLNIIHNNTTYINNLIDDLFLFSKLDMQKLDFNFEIVKFKAFMSDLMEEFDFVLKEKDIEFKFEDRLSEELEINIDGKRIYQVIRNVIGNAIKYGRQKDSIIKVELSNNNEWIKIEIKDNGPGIPEDKLSNIFNRFYRIDTERTKDFMSTGLGLAIAKEMVEAHGGKIYASSIMGKGSTFTIELPIK